MDSIRLDRARTFSREPFASLHQQPPRQQKQKKVKVSTNKVDGLSEQEPIYISDDDTDQQLDTSVEYNRLRYHEVTPFCIPHHVIPLSANNTEVEAYETTFAGSRQSYEQLTIRDILNPFSQYLQENINTKLLFLKQLFENIVSSRVNYDVAILCCDLESETMIFNSFDYAIRSTRLSNFASNKNLYGLIFKFRKKKAKSVKDSIVDVIIAFDSACNIHHPEAYKFFTGVHRKRPWLINLCIADSADIRIYNHNLHHPTSLIHWDTKVADLDMKTRNDLLFQPNRIADDIDRDGWVYYLARLLTDWVVEKADNDFTFKYPFGGCLLLFLNKFEHHHPIINPVSLPISYNKKPKTSKNVNPRVRPASANASVSQTVYVPSSSSVDPVPSRSSFNYQPVGYAFHSKEVTLSNKKKVSNNLLRMETRKKAKHNSLPYINHFIPDLRARPRVPRRSTLTAATVAEKMTTANAVTTPVTTTPVTTTPVTTTPVTAIPVTAIPVTTTSVTTKSVLPTQTVTKTQAKNTVDSSSIDSFFAEALAKFEKDLDAFKIKL